MNPFEGLTPEEIGSALIIGGVLAFLILIVIASKQGKEGMYAVFGVLLVTVLVFGVLKWVRG